MRDFTKIILVALALVLFIAPLAPEAFAEGWQDGVYRDSAPGYNDEVIVTVVVRDGKISELRAENKSGEESEYFKKAEAGLGAAIVEKQGVDGVDAVSGATGTSESILSAMGGILKQAKYAGEGGTASAPAPDAAGGRPAATPRPTLNPDKAEVFAGFGSTTNFRVGPGKDDTGAQVYSFNVTMASVLFDKDGKILDAQVDIYEVATPNYDGKSMPHFSGWPGKEGYNVTDLNTGKVTGVSENTEELAKQELADWKTKRERGDAYGMNPQNEWYNQMHNYEQWMIGKTVSEVRSWFARYTSERNGRPIKEGSDNADDRKVYAKLTDEEKAQLYDVVSMATMSLSDDHGLILEAIEKAYDNRTPVDGVELD